MSDSPLSSSTASTERIGAYSFAETPYATDISSTSGDSVGSDFLMTPVMGQTLDDMVETSHPFIPPPLITALQKAEQSLSIGSSIPYSDDDRKSSCEFHDAVDWDIEGVADANGIAMAKVVLQISGAEEETANAGAGLAEDTEDDFYDASDNLPFVLGPQYVLQDNAKGPADVEDAQVALPCITNSNLQQTL